LCLQIRPKEDDSIAVTVVSEIAIADKQSSSLSDPSQATDCGQSLPCEEKPLNIEQPQFTQAIDSSLSFTNAVACNCDYQKSKLA
jgi:hypothetical protein